MRHHPSRPAILLLLLFVVTGCNPEDKVVVDPVTVESPTERVTANRQTLSHLLPESAGHLVDVIQTDTETLIGTAGGLFTLTTAGLMQMHTTPVVGLAVHQDIVLVAHADHLHIWHGNGLTRSPLSDAFGEATITGLIVRDETLWISTDAGLFQFNNDEVMTLMDALDVRTVNGGGAATYLTGMIGEDDSVLALQPGDDSWQLLDFGSGPFEVIKPGDESLFGLLDGVIHRYVTDADNAVWRQVAIETDSSSGHPVETLETSDGGQLWGITSDSLFQYSRGVLTQVTRSDELHPSQLRVDLTGTAWLSDGTRLSAYFEDAPATREISWAASIGPFAEANCTRCHGALGTARELHSQEQWVSEIDSIIRVVEDGEMPADNQPLELGDAALLRAWKDGGLR